VAYAHRGGHGYWLWPQPDSPVDVHSFMALRTN
jgi:hypothetical protein